MKLRITRRHVAVMLALALFFAGCGGDDAADTSTTLAETTTTVVETTTTTVPETTTTVEETTTTIAPLDEDALLADHIVTSLADWKPVMTADVLFENLSDGDVSNDPFILSVRATEHYDLGHIEGAYNIPWKAIADPANLAKLPTDQQIVVYCYTGHTGQVAATLLRVLGYDAVNLKFGMMGWTDDDEILATGRYAEAPGYPTEEEANELTVEYEPPTLVTGETEIPDIVVASAQGFLADWKPVITAEALFENLADGDESNDPFILSVRAPEHYALGHIEDSFNIGWKVVTEADNLDDLPTDQPIVVYCYTGHTGQVATTALALLGYDVVNLKFGMMGWTDDDDILATARYAGAPGYPTETEANPLP